MDQTPMETGDRANHWDATYETRGTGSVSWFQPEPQVSLELIGALEVSGHKAVIDVGGGASFLTDRLVGRGWRDLTVLDVSASALDTARQRLPDDAPVTWLRQDLLAGPRSADTDCGTTGPYSTSWSTQPTRKRTCACSALRSRPAGR